MGSTADWFEIRVPVNLKFQLGERRHLLLFIVQYTSTIHSYANAQIDCFYNSRQQYRILLRVLTSSNRKRMKEYFNSCLPLFKIYQSLREASPLQNG